jgi:hypothetical protein
MTSTYTKISRRFPALLTGLTLLAGCPDGKENTETGTDTSPGPGSSTSGGPDTTSTGETPTTGADSTTSGVSETDGTTTAVTTTDGPTEPTTTGATTIDDSTTTDDTTTTGATTIDDSTTGDTTSDTTGGAGPVEQSCVAACELLVECQQVPDVEMCTTGCIEGSSGTPACEAASVAFNQCLAGQTCVELAMAGPDVCPDEQEAAAMACR